ncbi:tRNA (adenosine(37)-N6)-threonylcarbamoyltransferase complex dimerization subunit type 1 TsaB, partial [uncultured Enorma sp.]|uniref:tRNA (adenosine(37)-N6)-threonylcarbamoyltransferase complex dimerization subunit type 1 TsaB n=1 Tax=uncultured Enorma sp. TaxID=1714346 RepID=UPI0026601327
MKHAIETKFVAAIDTSTDMLACTVARIDGVDGAIDVLASGDHLCRRHANVELVTTLDAALAQAGLARGDVDAYVVGRGPGSFTGVRIGISTAKALAYGANVPLYGASTLDASAWTAWRAGVRGLLGVAADAMRGEVYPALYRLDDEGAHRLFDRERVVKAAVAVEEWAARADAAALQLTGDGLVRYGNRFEAAGLTTRLDRSLWWPSGEGLVLAWRAAAERVGEPLGTGDPALVLPIYTRLSDAEENERKRLGLQQSARSEISGVAEELAGRHLQFRPMGPADAEAVERLERACFEGAAHTPWSAEQFLSELVEPAVPRSWWVAHDDGELVGFAGGMVVERDIEILDVAVAPEHRRAGIARKLLSHVSYDAQMLGCATSSLEVEDGNDAAIS